MRLDQAPRFGRRIQLFLDRGQKRACVGFDARHRRAGLDLLFDAEAAFLPEEAVHFRPVVVLTLDPKHGDDIDAKHLRVDPRRVDDGEELVCRVRRAVEQAGLLAADHAEAVVEARRVFNGPANGAVVVRQQLAERRAWRRSAIEQGLDAVGLAVVEREATENGLRLDYVRTREVVAGMKPRVGDRRDDHALRATMMQRAESVV